jgi:hypothetical protein
MELRDGPEKERLSGIARLYCSAEQSADPDDTRPLFVAAVGKMMDEVSYGYQPRVHPGGSGAGCAPGRSWYLGGSRTFIDVHRGKATERLDFWRGSQPLINDVLYRTPRRVEGQKVRSLREELMVLSRVAAQVPAPPDTSCYPGNYRFAFLDTDTRIFRQGATIKLTPTIDIAPAGTQAVAMRCTSDWAVTGPAKLSADRTVLHIAPGAPVGAAVTVSFRHAGKAVSRELRVVGRDEVVLTGRWSQRALEGCEAGEPVGELEFLPENRFTVTFRPFETYRDYWGRYSFDPATRRIALIVEDGNFVPADLDLEGEAEHEAGRLVLRDMYLGSRNGGPRSGCTYTF